MSAEGQGAIDRFLKRVEDKLPVWLREDEKEKEDLLREMEEHIWDNAEELAEGGNITINHVLEAINRMGSPQSISKEFKKRGTPKVYITEEWWYWYKKITSIVVSVIVGIVLIVSLFQIGSSTIWKILGSMITGSFVGATISFLILSAIFIGLSMAGFLPSDFEDKIEIKGASITIDWNRAAKKKAEGKADYKSKEYKAVYQRAMGVKNEEPESDTYEYKYAYEYKYPKTRVEPRKYDKDYEKQLKKAQNKKPIKRGEVLSEAIWSILWSVFFIVQPIESLNQYFTPEFLLFVRMSSFIPLAIAIIKILQVFAGMYQIGTQQLLLVLMIVANIIVLPIIYEAIHNDGVLTMFSDAVSFSWRPGPEVIVMKVILWISFAGKIIESLEYLGKISSYSTRLKRYTTAMDALQA